MMTAAWTAWGKPHCWGVTSKGQTSRVSWRPWPWSIVMCSGKKNAFRRVRQAGQLVEELGLIGFDDQEKVGLFFFHQMVGRGDLSVEGVGADQGAAQVQIPEQVFEGGDFIGLGRDLDWAAEELGVGVQGAKELYALAVDFGGGAGAFAINGQRGDAGVLGVGAQPVVDEAVQFHGVQALEDAADGGFTGGVELAGFAATAGAQAAELVLVEGLGEIADIDQRVIARDHGGGGNGHDGGDATVSPATVAAGVVQGAQRLEQALGLFSAQRILPGRWLSAIGRPGRRHQRRGEEVAGVADQRVEENRLGLPVQLIEIQAGASPAFGDPDFDPIGRSIASAFEAFGVHIGFDQSNGVAVLFQPVGTEALEVQAQAVGSQVGRVASGGEQGEASVAGDQMACGLSLSVGPTDPSVAGPQMEGGAGPTQQADPLPVLLDDIPERLADHAMLFEVVVFSDQFVPSGFLFKALNQLDGDRFGGDLSKDFGDEMLTV